MCNCKTQGFRHWLRYLRLRYHYRDFWAHLRYGHKVIDGEDVWVDFIDDGHHRIHNRYPGPNMTKDEWDHWCLPGIERRQKQEKADAIREVEVLLNQSKGKYDGS